MKAKEINTIVNKEFGPKLSKMVLNQGIKMPDPAFLPPTDEKVDEVLADTQVDHHNYEKRVFDCDKFAFLLSGKFILKAKNEGQDYAYLFGRIWARMEVDGKEIMHAVNWYINQDKKIRLIEPQNDQVIPISNISEVFHLAIP